MIDGIISLMMECTPLLTICIPTKNAEKHIDRCLSLIFEGDCSRVEVLICDESTDSTKEQLFLWQQRLPDGALRIITQAQPGIMGARKSLFLEASGEFVYFIDADDCLTQGALSRLCEYLSQNKPDLLLLPCLITRGECADSLPVFLPNTFNQYINALFFSDEYNALWSKIYKRSLLSKKDVDGLPNIRLGEDKVWNMALAEKVRKMMVLPGAPIYCYQVVPQSASRNKKASTFCHDFLSNTSFAGQIGQRLLPKTFERDYPAFYQASLANILRAALKAEAAEKKRSKPLLNAIRNSEQFKRYKRGIAQCPGWKNRLLLRLFSWGLLL